LLEDKKMKELKLLENTLTLEVTMSNKNHKEMESELQLIIDKEFSNLRLELQDSYEERNKMQQKHSLQLQQELSAMFSLLDEQKKSMHHFF
jgi:hypothetical protein